MCSDLAVAVQATFAGWPECLGICAMLPKKAVHIAVTVR
ncbi:hypothetical protein D805_0295 [Bifidobacterium thermophilum RBL67]|uniref:Uncharacterized protein n=1 Tax=Bifidobacterium thermophilum RBL67 TaxID=1254439 RepID=M4RPV3_9BIFI|nr:hypothetical protein D805_0295 [Bifidobacterium thermophilum RBL67]